MFKYKYDGMLAVALQQGVVDRFTNRKFCLLNALNADRRISLFLIPRRSNIRSMSCVEVSLHFAWFEVFIKFIKGVKNYDAV